MELSSSLIIEQPLTPSVYEIVEKTTEQTTVTDVLFGSFAVIGLIAICGLVLGGVFAGVMIWSRRRRDKEDLAEGRRDLLGLNKKE